MNEQTPRRSGVLLWAILLFGLTASSALWLTLTGGNYRDFSPAILLIGYSPALVAILVAGLLPGAGGLRSLLRQLLRWRTGAHWYAIALVGPFVLALAVTAAFVLFGGASPAAILVAPTTAAFLGPLIAGSLGEELGWRGFAQPRLQSRLGPLVAAVIVGVLWTVWHLWPMLTPAGARETTTVDVAQTVIRLVATAVLYAWLYNRSGGVLPVVLLAHAGHNLAIEAMPPEVIGTDVAASAIAALYLLAAIAVVVFDRDAWRPNRGGADRAAAMERIRASQR